MHGSHDRSPEPISHEMLESPASGWSERLTRTPRTARSSSPPRRWHCLRSTTCPLDAVRTSPGPRWRCWRW